MNWSTIPFFRLLLPGLLGLLLAYWMPWAAVALWGSYLFGGVLLLLLLGQYLGRYSPFFWRFWGVGLQLLLLLGGYIWTYERVLQPSDQPIPLVWTEFRARVNRLPQPKRKTVQLQLELAHYYEAEKGWRVCQEPLLLYLPKDSQSLALNYGDELVLLGKPRAFEAPKNYGQFDAGAYYGQKGISAQMYSKKWQLGAKAAPSFWGILIDWRLFLKARLRRLIPDQGGAYSVAAALILGDKTDLDQDLRQAYSTTGASHVLAVSGLHVGLLASILGALIKLFRRRSAWRYSFREAIILLLGIWLFALLTGAAPSVCRASSMFSLLILGQCLGRNSSIYNSLSGSAFLLLLYDPANLWNLGFQLSYLAVLGIVYFQPKIYRWYYFSFWPLQYIWGLFTVSLAAQLATLPLTLYYFHQFPTYFWLSGLLVVPLAGILLPLGLAALLCLDIPILGGLLSWALVQLLRLMNGAILALETWPLAKISAFELASWELLLAYLALLSLVLSLAWRRMLPLLLGACCLLLILGHNSWQQLEAEKQANLQIYQTNKGLYIDYFYGRTAYSYYDSTVWSSVRQRSYLSAGSQRRAKIKTLVEQPIAAQQNQFLLLGQKRILLLYQWPAHWPEKKIDYLIADTRLSDSLFLPIMQQQPNMQLIRTSLGK